MRRSTHDGPRLGARHEGEPEMSGEPLHRALPNSELRTLARQGHLAAHTAPELLAGEIIGFLTGSQTVHRPDTLLLRSRLPGAAQSIEPSVPGHVLRRIQEEL
jgi:hypothetical protein